MTIGYSKFNKIELATWFRMTGVAKSADGSVSLLNPDDSTGVSKIVMYLQLVTAVGNTVYDSLPQA